MPRINRRQAPDASPTPEIWRRIAERLGLSESERQLAELLFAGCLEKQASCKLGMAESTAHSHIRKIYEKLKVRNRVQLCRKVFDVYLQLLQEDAKNPPVGELLRIN